MLPHATTQADSAAPLSIHKPREAPGVPQHRSDHITSLMCRTGHACLTYVSGALPTNMTMCKKHTCCCAQHANCSLTSVVHTSNRGPSLNVGS
jgi:hypothetical protein